MHPENHSLSRTEAAEICGLTDAQLRNLMNRDGLFASRRRGPGYPMPFTIRQLMQIGTVKFLMEFGFDADDAVRAVEPFSAYGQLQERGNFILGWDEHQKRLKSGSWDRNGTYLRVALWPIFREIIDNWLGQNPDDEVNQYLAKMDALRETHGNAD